MAQASLLNFCLRPEYFFAEPSPIFLIGKNQKILKDSDTIFVILKRNTVDFCSLISGEAAHIGRKNDHAKKRNDRICSLVPLVNFGVAFSIDSR